MRKAQVEMSVQRGRSTVRAAWEFSSSRKNRNFPSLDVRLPAWVRVPGKTFGRVTECQLCDTDRRLEAVIGG